MPAVEFSEDVNPENLIQMGLLMRFSGIASVLIFIIILQINELDIMLSLIIIIGGIVSIPIGYLLGTQMIEEGKRRLKEEMSTQKNEVSSDTDHGS